MASPSLLKSPKYIQLADEFREQIERGILKPGDRLPSLVEMRDAHGVTSGTIIRTYAHLEKDGLVAREQGRGTFVKRQATMIIGVAGLLSPEHPYFAQILDGLHGVAGEAGVELLLLGKGMVISRAKVDGVLFCDFGFAKSEMWRYLPAGMPCVSTLVSARDFVGVMGDEYQGAYDLTTYLLELGHRRIGYIYDPFLTPRFDGYQHALRNAGIEVDASLLRTVSIRHTKDPTYSAAAYAAMKTWLKEDWAELGCTALMTQNDDAAKGLIHALNQAGWSVPDQISVAGFDSTENDQYLLPRLTSVAVPLREIGKTAMELLMRQVNGEDIPASTIVLPTRVVVGGSTKRI